MTEESCVIVTCSWCFLLEIVFIIGNSCLLLFLIIVSVFISSLIHHIFVKINAKYNWCIYRPYTYDILCVHWLQMVVLGYFLQYLIAVHIDNLFFISFTLVLQISTRKFNYRVTLGSFSISWYSDTERQNLLTKLVKGGLFWPKVITKL